MIFFYIIISICILLPFFNKGFLYTGDDILFNINRIEEVFANLKNFNPVSFVSTFSNNQVGIGTNIFYPSFWIYPFAIFKLIFANTVHAIYAGLMFFNLLTCFIAHFSFKAFSKSSSRAFLFTNLYFFSTYRWIDILHRFDISESIAIALIPLVFWSFYETCFRNQHNWPWLAASMALLLYAHILSFLITTFFLILIFILNIRGVPNLKITIVHLFYSIFIFGILSASFLYTFIKTYLAIPIQSPKIGILSNSAIKPMVLLGSTLENTISKNGAHFNLGIISLIIIILAILFFKQLDSLYKQTLVWIIFCILISTNLFPWHIFQSTSLTLLQFPWRIFIITNFFVCFLGVKIFQFVKIKHIDLILVLILLLLNTGTLKQFLTINDQNPNLSSTSHPYSKVFKHKKLKIAKEGYKYLYPQTYKDDYIPINTKISKIKNRQVFKQTITHHMFISGTYARVKKTKYVSDGAIITLPEVKKGTKLSVPFYIYQTHNYRVWVNGKRSSFGVNNFKLLELESRSSKNIIRIQYIPTQMQLFSIWISIIGLITLLVYGFYKWMKIPKGSYCD